MTVNGKPTISITQTSNEQREIDNLQIALQFHIDGAPHFAVVQHGTFNNIATYGLDARNGRWDGSRFTGNFLTLMGDKQSLKQAALTIDKGLAQAGSIASVESVNGGPLLPNINIVSNDPRAITGMQVIPEFTINGANHATNLGIGDFDRHTGLGLNGLNGTLGFNDWWTGNFLSVQYSGFDTQIDPVLLWFLNIFYVVCTLGAAAEGEIKKGFPIQGDPNLWRIRPPLPRL